MSTADRGAGPSKAAEARDSGEDAVLSLKPETNKSRRRKLKKASTLGEAVTISLEQYFELLEGQQPSDLYKLVQDEVEAPMLRAVMENCNYNQSLASDILGLNRGTLRKKLKQYKIGKS